jgi:nicotinate-nucleotide adenylyltransferase
MNTTPGRRLGASGNAVERIGLFGGTFNPIHWGHLRAAEEIKEAFDLKKVVFIPARIPPHKSGESILSSQHRLQMVQLAIHDTPGFTVSDFEIRRNSTSYSIFTIEYFQRKLGSKADLYFLMGIDSFLEISTWKDFHRLFSLVNFIIMARPGYPKEEIPKALPVDVAEDFYYNPQKKCYVHESNYKIFFPEITLLDISSSEIRRRIKTCQSVRHLAPPGVAHYIKQHSLYRNNVY